MALCVWGQDKITATAAERAGLERKWHVDVKGTNSPRSSGNKAGCLGVMEQGGRLQEAVSK